MDRARTLKRKVSTVDVALALTHNFQEDRHTVLWRLSTCYLLMLRN